MDESFDGRTVVLTGVGRRGQVGEAVARAFAACGAHVVLVSRTPSEVEERAAELRREGFGASAHACDLTDAEQVASVAREVSLAHDGRVDALVSMAGGFGMTGKLDERDVDAWDHQLSINLTTAYVSTRAFLPMLRAARGSVVYFASAAALPGSHTAGLAAYAAAKSGVVALMRAVADDERGAGVRANALAPMAIRTSTNEEAMGASAHYVERDTVADVVMFLCSEHGRGVTGQVIELKG